MTPPPKKKTHHNAAQICLKKNHNDCIVINNPLYVRCWKIETERKLKVCWDNGRFNAHRELLVIWLQQYLSSGNCVRIELLLIWVCTHLNSIDLNERERFGAQKYIANKYMFFMSTTFLTLKNYSHFTTWMGLNWTSWYHEQRV